jgi:hypothetical protein
MAAAEARKAQEIPDILAAPSWVILKKVTMPIKCINAKAVFFIDALLSVSLTSSILSVFIT